MVSPNLNFSDENPPTKAFAQASRQVRFESPSAMEIESSNAAAQGVMLARGLKEKSQNYKKLLAQVLKWTAGQPILTQTLCRLLVEAADAPAVGEEAQWVENLVLSRLIADWESFPALKHLAVIRDRLTTKHPRNLELLKVYQQILEHEVVVATNSPEQQELIRLGLVIKEQGKLKVHNLIYKQIFNQTWVDNLLKDSQKTAETSDADFFKKLEDLERRLLMAQVDILSDQNNNDENQQLAQVLYEVLRDVTLQIGKLLGADRTTIFLLNEEKTELWSLVAQNEAGEFLDIHLQIGEGIAGQVAQTKKVIHIPNNVYDDPRSQRVKESDQKFNYSTQNILAFPILDENEEAIAVIQLLNKLQVTAGKTIQVSPKGFTLVDLERLAKCVVPVRRILESCQSCYRATKKLQATAALAEATRSLDKINLDTKVILGRVMNAAKKLMNADRSTLWLVDRDRNDLWTEIPSRGQLRCEFGVGFVGRVAQTLQPINIPFDLYNHPEAENAKKTDEQTRYRTCSLLAMPVLSPDGELLGVTQLVNKRKGNNPVEYNPADFPNIPDYFKASFDRNDLQSMQVFNERVGVILQFVKTHKRLKDLTQIDPQEAIHKTLAIFSQALPGKTEGGWEKAIYSFIQTLEKAIAQYLSVETATLLIVNEESQEFWSILEQNQELKTVSIKGDRGITHQFIVAQYRKAINRLSHLQDPVMRVNLSVNQTIQNFLLFPVLDASGNLIALLRLVNKLRPTLSNEEPLAQRMDTQGFTQLEVDRLKQYTVSLIPILQGFQSFYQEIHTFKQQREALDPLETAIRFVNQSHRHPEAIIKNVMQAVKTLTQADRTTLWLLDRASSQLWTRIPQSDGSTQEMRVPLGEGFVGQVAQRGEILNIPFDLYDHPGSEKAKQVDRETGYRTCSLLAMPVLSEDGEVLGVTQLVNKRRSREAADLREQSTDIPEAFRASFDQKDRRNMELLNKQVGLLLVEIQGGTTL